MKITKVSVAGIIAAFTVSAWAQNQTAMGSMPYPDFRSLLMNDDLPSQSGDMWAQNDDMDNSGGTAAQSTTTTTTEENYDYDYEHHHHHHDRIFNRDELDLDLFGTATMNEYLFDQLTSSRVRRNARLGYGAGASFFVTRWLGFGGDAWTENPAHDFVNNASGSMIVRFPMDEIHLAPYIFGGAGYQFYTARAAFLHAGAGLEVRFCRNFGIFVDARAIWPRKIPVFGMGRAGIRIAF